MGWEPRTIVQQSWVIDDFIANVSDAWMLVKRQAGAYHTVEKATVANSKGLASTVRSRSTILPPSETSLLFGVKTPYLFIIFFWLQTKSP